MSKAANVTDERNTTLNQSGDNSLETNSFIYVGVAVGGGIVICIVVIIVVLLVKRRVLQRIGARARGNSTRRLFVRGFSTVTQRGAIDSTAEFEIVNMSVSSDDGLTGNQRGSQSSRSELTPKKPERRRTRTTSSNVKYENVVLDANSGFVVRKSVSMSSGIPYIDNTLDSRISEKDEDLDDVFK